MNKNQEALALAFKSLSVSLSKINEFGLKADTTDDELGSIAIKLSKLKAETEGKDDPKPYVKGQKMWLESLRKVCAMSNKEALDYYYRREFAEVATEDEMLRALDEMR